jgi:hypothetical protein
MEMPEQIEKMYDELIQTLVNAKDSWVLDDLQIKMIRFGFEKGVQSTLITLSEKQDKEEKK